MELIERYLGAVRWNLPAGKGDDIVAELADVIANRVEEREDMLGRPLRRGEVSAVLKDLGHPIQVAGRYHGQRVLIGPEVFPFYWFVLWAVLAVVGGVMLVEAIGRVVFSDASLVRALMQGWAALFQSLLVNAALVTLAFAVIERTGWLNRYLEQWEPEKLPDIQLHLPRRRRVDGFAELLFGLLFLLWWVGAIAIPFVPHDARVTVTPAPVWAALYWPIAALAVLGMVHGLAALLRSRAKLLRAGLAVVQAAAIVAIAWVLHGAGPLVTVTGRTLAPDQVADVQRGIGIGLGIALAIVPLIAVVSCVVELWRIHRER